jgi:hypothetical protein
LHTGPDSSRYDLPRVDGAELHDDVALHASSFPVGPAQPTIHDTVFLPAPDAGVAMTEGVTVAVYEFESEPGFDNAFTAIEVTDIEGDIDLWLDRRVGDGEWREVAAGDNGSDIGAPEHLDTGRLGPGTYRLRIDNYSSVPGDIEVEITFSNQRGETG